MRMSIAKKKIEHFHLTRKKLFVLGIETLNSKAPILLPVSALEIAKEWDFDIIHRSDQNCGDLGEVSSSRQLLDVNGSVTES
jgi:hypothetical protein